MPMQDNTMNTDEEQNLDCHGNPMPDWICVRAPYGIGFAETLSVDTESSLKTICPNGRGITFLDKGKRKDAAFMIMGDECTRMCSFCFLEKGKPVCLDKGEPGRLAGVVKGMDLRHVVITSVDRDDLDDGGVGHYVEVIKKIREAVPNCLIEVLVPDFRYKDGAAEILADTRPDVFGHNLETVPRLFSSIRCDCDYLTSLKLLKDVKDYDPSIFTKSGLMVGLGESNDEVYSVMDDLRNAGVDFLTIGQYLQPSSEHVPLDRYITPEEFLLFDEAAKARGFMSSTCSPLTHFVCNYDDISQNVKADK